MPPDPHGLELIHPDPKPNKVIPGYRMTKRAQDRRLRLSLWIGGAIAILILVLAAHAAPPSGSLDAVEPSGAPTPTSGPSVGLRRGMLQVAPTTTMTPAANEACTRILVHLREMIHAGVISVEALQEHTKDMDKLSRGVPRSKLGDLGDELDRARRPSAEYESHSRAILKDMEFCPWTSD